MEKGNSVLAEEKKKICSVVSRVKGKIEQAKEGKDQGKKPGGAECFRKRERGPKRGWGDRRGEGKLTAGKEQKKGVTIRQMKNARGKGKRGNVLAG